ncbi:MAG: LicD family protein [Kiritimatiellae bacterium]|nr:LicD family protein [Kiritimatiellia bacterium]
MDNGQTLAKLHELQLKIALEVKRVCEKNGLRCVLLYGTLLGAVRHGGFIPWDDDMDMGMLRADYDKFAEACARDLGEEFLLQTWDTDPRYPFPLGKMRLKRTHAQEKFAPEGTENGIFVDLYPLDAVPDGAWARKVTGWKYRVLKRLLWVKKGYGRCIREESARQRLRYDATSLAVRFLSYGWMKRCLHEAMTKHEGRPTRQVAAPGNEPYAQQAVDRAWMDDLAPIRFEGEEFLAFRDPDPYLRNVFGDYMTPPPPEKRHTHELGSVDFGPYGGTGQQG